MNISEIKLKEHILMHYNSLREFALKIDMPYSTMDSIFKRGIANSSITNVLKICKALSISADALYDGQIVEFSSIPAEQDNLTSENSSAFSPAVSAVISLMAKMNANGQERVKEYAELIITKDEYKKICKSAILEKQA